MRHSKVVNFMKLMNDPPVRLDGSYLFYCTNDYKKYGTNAKIKTSNGYKLIKYIYENDYEASYFINNVELCTKIPQNIMVTEAIWKNHNEFILKLKNDKSFFDSINVNILLNDVDTIFDTDETFQEVFTIFKNQEKFIEYEEFRNTNFYKNIPMFYDDEYNFSNVVFLLKINFITNFESSLTKTSHVYSFNSDIILNVKFTLLSEYLKLFNSSNVLSNELIENIITYSENILSRKFLLDYGNNDKSPSSLLVSTYHISIKKMTQFFNFLNEHNIIFSDTKSLNLLIHFSNNIRYDGDENEYKNDNDNLHIQYSEMLINMTKLYISLDTFKKIKPTKELIMIIKHLNMTENEIIEIFKNVPNYYEDLGFKVYCYDHVDLMLDHFLLFCHKKQLNLIFYKNM